MSSSSLTDSLETQLERLEALAADGRTDEIDPAVVQRLMAAAVRIYSMKTDSEGSFPVVAAGSLNATDVMVTSSALLRAVNIAVFELGLWQSWAH